MRCHGNWLHTLVSGLKSILQMSTTAAAGAVSVVLTGMAAPIAGCVVKGASGEPVVLQNSRQFDTEATQSPQPTRSRLDHQIWSPEPPNLESERYTNEMQ